MTVSPARATPTCKRASRKWPFKRRDDSGLTTLEWLLIVAAVAGLAALAVVLVQNVVSDTSEQISGASARLTAAKIAAQEVTDDARAETATAANVSDLNTEWKGKCKRILITYGDVRGIGAWWVNDLDNLPNPLDDQDISSETDWNDDDHGCHVPDIP